MAISRDKKQTLVAELTELFQEAKCVATAKYQGLSVADLQELRANARENNVTIKVVKNRLVKVTLLSSDKHKDTDLSELNGQLLYAFSNEDEVMPAQVLNAFAKKHPELELASGFDESGAKISVEDMKALANLPSKDQLRGIFVGTLAAPLTQMLGVLNGAQRGMTQVMSQRAEKI